MGRGGVSKRRSRRDRERKFKDRLKRQAADRGAARKAAKR